MASDTDRTLSSEAEIAAYLHRTRMAILDVLRDGAATATQIAARLGVHPANLTRHIRVLEEAGLVVLVEKRDTGRNLEKYYAAIGWQLQVAPDTGRPDRAPQDRADLRPQRAVRRAGSPAGCLDRPHRRPGRSA